MASPRGAAKELQLVCSEEAGCLIRSIHIAKWKRAEGLGVKAGEEPKRACVEGLDVEVESGLENSDLVGVDLGTWMIQDLLVMLLSIQKEMSAVGDYAADAASLYSAAQECSGWGGGLGVSGRGCMLGQEWAVGSADPRGQVQVSEVVGDGVERLCLGGNGEVPRSGWEWRKARVRPSRGSK